MNWYLIVFFSFLSYTTIAYYLYKKRPFGDHITFYGPIIGIKSFQVSFFNRFARFSSFFRIYGTFGVFIVAGISLIISILLIFSLRYTILIKPMPIGIYEPQNILLLPGINDYIPSTIAVWLAFIVTIAIHEFGHGILCKIEGIKVKSIGILIAIIPIGFFVEPNEEDLENCKGLPKARMFGAGIINNIIIGIICFLTLVSILGMIIPPSAPVIQGIYKDYPAYNAGIQPNSIIISVNGINVSTVDEVSKILTNTKPDEQITLFIEHDGIFRSYQLTLVSWPSDIKPVRESGFVGIHYFPSKEISYQINEALKTPAGLLYLLTLPFDTSQLGLNLRMLAFDTVDMAYYRVPFPQFWTIVHLLFWCGWININVGIFNAIPMIPLDGGYIMREGVESLLKRKGYIRFSEPVIFIISWLMLIVMVSLIALPYLFHLY